MDIVSVGRDDINSKKDELEAEIGPIKETLDKIYGDKDTEREKYYTDKLAYENQYDMCKYADWMVREKLYLKDKEENRAKRLEERKAEKHERENPFTREIEICDHLLAFCHR